jgi:dienelactone hydrolase
VVREQIASALDLVVQVGRQPGGGRSVLAVAEVGGLDDRGRLATRPLTQEGRLVQLPQRPARAVDAPRPDAAWCDR